MKFTDKDQLFLRFQGPSTILVQSRTAPISEVFKKEDFSELADTEPGALPAPTKIAGQYTVDQSRKKIVIGSVDDRPTTVASGRHSKGLKVAIVKDGKLEFQDSDFKAFTR